MVADEESISADQITHLHHSVLQASRNEKFIRLHVKDEVGSDRPRQILKCRVTETSV